jgi:CSLREA domain-containing protein
MFTAKQKVQFNKRKLKNLFFAWVVLTLLLGSAGLPTRVRAFSQTITVDTALDNTTVDGFCSLREAITNANNNAGTYKDCTPGSGSEFIIFSNNLGPTITLGSPLPTISDTAGLTINGGGNITISGNGAYRVFLLGVNVPLTLDGLTVTHGNSGASGGGAYVNSGSTLTVKNSTFSYNHAVTYGGGIDNYGVVILTNSTFTGNSAVDSGGGLISSGTVTISNSTFTSNTSGYGGGLRTLGGTTTISQSSFISNTASSFGGGIFNPVGTMTITGSTFSGNTASAGGGIENEGNLTLGDSTFYNNFATLGGGLANSFLDPNYGHASIINSTFSNNSAADSFSGGGVYNAAYLSLNNTIIANSPLGADCEDAGIMNASANNLIENAAHACGLTNGVNANITGSDPNLGPGTGSPVYLPLNGGSLAINTANDGACAAAPINNTSQNGLSRPQGAHCDIGSYEADVTPPVVLSIVRADPNPTDAASVHFTVTFSEPVYGVSIGDFVLAHPGIAGAIVSVVSNTTGSTWTATIGTGTGLGTLRLDLVDRDTILDAANLHLGGDGLGNGSFSIGEVYQVRWLKSYLPLVRR